MISTPRWRAALTTSFIRGAISATRRVAPWHQCWFHMSQMTTAVFFGSHSTVFSATCHSPLPLLLSTRERVGSLNESAPAAGPPAKRKRTNQEETAGIDVFFMVRFIVNAVLLKGSLCTP